LSTSRSTSASAIRHRHAQALEEAAHQLAVVELDGERPIASSLNTAWITAGIRRRSADRQRVLADHVDVALVELAEAPALRALAAIHALHLVAPEREAPVRARARPHSGPAAR
jgi:hypothetical protein